MESGAFQVGSYLYSDSSQKSIKHNVLNPQILQKKASMMCHMQVLVSVRCELLPDVVVSAT